MHDAFHEKTLATLARLARLRIDPGEAAELREKLELVIESLRRLDELELDDVEPMTHADAGRNRLDEDVPEPAMAVDELLRNAPATEGRHIAVPKVIDAGREDGDESSHDHRGRP